MAKIVIVGSGSYGTALAKVFSKRNEIVFYSIEPDVVKDINSNHANTKYLPKVRLNSNISATADINIIREAELIILAVPSSAVRPACASLKPNYKGQLVISTSKGLSPEGKVMTEVIEDVLGCPASKVLAISGPSIASELAAGKCTQVMLGGELSAARKAKSILETDTLLLKHTSDKRGIQLLGFYKNILAIMAGLSDGLEMGNNFKAALISHAYHEFYYLNIDKNVARHTFVDVAGLGDLYVTAISEDSRNRRFGLLLAEGLGTEEIQKKIGTVIEGYENLKLMKALAEKRYLDENLINLLHSFISRKHTKEEMRAILKRYLGSSELKAILLGPGIDLQKDKPLSDYFLSLKPRYIIYHIKSGRNNHLDFLNKQGLGPKNCLYVDSSNQNLLAAEKAGLGVVHFKKLAGLKAAIEKNSL
jgi:glycerol-3-phosphate dehydrogenase (NAD(P)+)